jgi:type I restriction-modification system DNA methylase subunit
MTKEEAKQKVAELVQKRENLKSSEVKKYNEEATKQGFILPLFNALGWDTEETTNEVVPEEKASKGRVDYAFKLKSVSQFYVEAKPLKAELISPDYIKQVITYACNKGVTWAVLTNFDEIRLFNAQTGHPFINLTHENFLSMFDKLWLLSKESLENGLLRKEAIATGNLPPTVPIEKRLFEQLRAWREELFNQLHSYNTSLKLPEIDEIIQRLFNRLIFIRTCEDRNLEERRLLAAAQQWKSGGHKGELIESIRPIFIYYNDNYDSELFAKHMVDNVFIEGQTIEKMILGLYDIPGGVANYDFSIIDADILGTVYEQYLGYVAIKVKEQAQAQLKLGLPDEEIIKITGKGQHRKEQGIYYTPTFITDYIVRETVGRFIEEHDYNEIRTVKILDPACGSGSFLIRAYEELLNYHAKQHNLYANDLPQQDRLPILLNNIFGVDLDIQAVEIVRLNLLLRTLTKQGKLPFVGDNIRQGNSLVAGSSGELKKYFGDDWKAKKPFNWKDEFPEIMKNGGFDIVIGNPPWIESKRMDGTDKSYYETNFKSMHGQYDIFNGFIERGLQVLKDGGLLGFIIPSRFVMNPDYEPFRKMLLENARIIDICDVGEHIFEGVEMPALTIILEKQPNKEIRDNNSITIKINVKELKTNELDEFSVVQKKFINESNSIFTIYQRPAIDSIIIKMEKNREKFENFVDNARGVEIGKKSSVVFDKQKEPSYVPFLVGEDIDRYTIFSHRYLKLGEPDIDYKSPDLYKGEKIIIRKTGTGIRATLDIHDYYVIQVIYIFKPKNSNMDSRYLLGLINSKLLSFYYFAKFGEKNKKVFPHLRQGPVLQLPVHTIKFDNSTEKAKYEKLIELVDVILDLNKQLIPVKNAPFNERDELLKEIQKTDKEIDNLVYDLYGLTEEERKIIEEEVK